MLLQFYITKFDLLTPKIDGNMAFQDTGNGKHKFLTLLSCIDVLPRLLLLSTPSVYRYLYLLQLIMANIILIINHSEQALTSVAIMVDNGSYARQIGI